MKTPGCELRPYQLCNWCVMDTSDPEILFDTHGRCNHCKAAMHRMAAAVPRPEVAPLELEQIVERIRKAGKGKPYDCVVGVSGGVDSTSVIRQASAAGLRMFPVHFDNGWNDARAADNIKRTLDKFRLDLYTHVVDWEEFRDIQLSFLRASLPNCEIPTDHGIFALLWSIASKERIRYILTGSNLATESIMPAAWSYFDQDLRHLRAVHAAFGHVPIRTLPTISATEYLHGAFILGTRQIRFLDYVNYNRSEATKNLIADVGWTDYGSKHFESIWTRFFQGYYLPNKFGFDKRRAHLSTLICSGQTTRAEALDRLQEPAYDEGLLLKDLRFVLKKFRLTEAEFAEIIRASPRKHSEFPRSRLLGNQFAPLRKAFRWIATHP